MKSRVVLLLCLTLGWLGCGPRLAVLAADVSDLQVGYWWAAQQDSTSLPAPPQVPAGGLYVSSNATGLVAVSAVSFRLPAGTIGATLVMHVASIHDVDGVSIAAYHVTSAWTPATAGSWSQRPAYGPLTQRVVGKLSTDQTTMTFDLSPMTVAGSVDVAIAPVPSSTAPEQYTSQDVAFNPVTDADISSTAAVSTPPSTPSESGTGPASSTGSANGTVTPPEPRAAAPATGELPTGVSSAPAPAPVVAPPTVSPNTAPAATSGPVTGGGRSTRDTLILAFLLANTLTFLLQRGRKALATPDVSIYDLPPG